VSENRVLIRISGPDREEVTGGYRKLHNEALCYLYCFHNAVIVIEKLRIIIWAGGKKECLVGSPQRKRSCVRPSYRRQDNVGMENDFR